ncbi:hypothetical protein LAZ67_4003066 [Cordylochernes scorpioides]|uniref:Uncharacterized protein n=1 Tax=Cordylochernes scorpioides TaxID=51811 RepID=A0ABY6KEC6_9ARAC|nr:hypothetical protein LAZ67_4003066 [Cordylochernes scorpioides]
MATNLSSTFSEYVCVGNGFENIKKRITYQQLEKSVSIESAAINTIINDHLKYRKLVSRWVSRSLTEDQKLGRVKWCNSTLKKSD